MGMGNGQIVIIWARVSRDVRGVILAHHEWTSLDVVG